MKVKDLFESRGGITTFDFGIEYELEYTTPEGEIDYKMVNVSGTVTETTDMYGTGDSPTDYEVNVTSVVDAETGEAIPEAAISKENWAKIEQRAIDSVENSR